MILYLIRHGERMPNRSERQEVVNLTEKGVEQAYAIGAFLREHPVDIVLSSPKWRTVDTARCATADDAIPVHVWPCLIEFDLYGPLDFVPALFPADCVYEPLRSLPEETPGHADPNLTESFGFTFRRAHFALQCIKHLRAKRVAVFGHKIFNSVLIWTWLGAFGMRERDCYPQEPGCINILETGKPPVINYTGHLTGGGPPEAADDLDDLAALLIEALST